ncbi:MAG: PDZ domain-containing protein, partial [Phycisphaerales bacterium]
KKRMPRMISTELMQDGKRVTFKFLCFVMACSLVGLGGCRKSSDRLEGEPLSEVLLRYTPRVGQTDNYNFFMNLDKTFFKDGKWRKEPNERLEGVISIETVEQNGDSYRTTADIRMGDSNLTKEALDAMKDKAEAIRMYDLNISDRYVSDEGGLSNLYLPEEPVSPGAQWGGEQSFTFGDMATVEAPVLKMSYRLVKAVENKDGRFCLVESEPVTDEIEVPLQIGQLGLQCDATATVTAVREGSDAHGKIKVGDILVAVNGERAVAAKDWNILYGRFIGTWDNVGADIVLTIKRDGREQDLEVEKSFATLGTMGVKISNATRKVVFDIDNGIIVSDKASPVYSVTYDFLDEFPFTDNYMGAAAFRGRAGTKSGPRIYRNQWKMELLQ